MATCPNCDFAGSFEQFEHVDLADGSGDECLICPECRYGGDYFEFVEDDE